MSSSDNIRELKKYLYRVDDPNRKRCFRLLETGMLGAFCHGFDNDSARIYKHVTFEGMFNDELLKL
jgi:hypothetical protein